MTVAELIEKLKCFDGHNLIAFSYYLKNGWCIEFNNIEDIYAFKSSEDNETVQFFINEKLDMNYIG